MRVDSVMPRYQTKFVSRNNEIQKTTVSHSVPINESLYSLNNTSGVWITFTGKDKNINQFVSYAPENKRYGIKQYNLGGLGVVAQEAPNSWRTREGLDVRDFSPYHSYGNDDGGIRVVKLAKDKNGRYVSAYKVSDFITARHNESLDELRTRLDIPKEQELAFVIQQPPNEKGLSKIIRLEDTGISGSVVRPGTESIMTVETVPYRMFRAIDIQDPITLASNKYKQKLFDEIEKPYRESIESEVKAQFAEELEQAKETDRLFNESEYEKYEQLKKENPGIDFKVSRKNEAAVEEKIKAEIKKRLNAEEIQSEINTKYEASLNSDEVRSALAKITEHAAPEVPERNAAYFLYTKGLSQFENAYGAGNSSYGAYGAYGSYGTYGTYGTTGKNGIRAVSTNVMYADNCRALVDAMPKLNTPEHGNYNPASWWLHDRPAFITINEIANYSARGDKYYTGLKAHGTFHNPGRDYQGAESNPFEFYRMVASAEDIRELNAHPQAEQLRDIEAKWATATPEERKFANQILRPFLENFLDDFVDEATDTRTFNISMTPVAGVKVNPDNFSAGSVSRNFGREMKSPDTPDIAPFMTNKLAEIDTYDVDNGNTPANLRLNDPTADFCQKDEINGLTMIKNGMTYEKDGKKITVPGFTPYKYERYVTEDGKVLDNIDEVLNAKKANTKWFLDAIGSAYERGGSSAVTKMFFSDSQIVKKGASVVGHLSGYKEGDMLFMGWGRPDPQKGYPSTFQAFLDFLRNPDVPKEVKQHTKLVVGAGVWDEGARDYKWVKDIIRQIEELDGGIYKGNACYVNGFFPNRLVGCATYSIFTSRFEPFGITPVESFGAGTPVISTNTGGAPDFIAATRGYLTNNPYLRSPEHLGVNQELAGLSGREYAETLDSIRMHANAKEVSGCIASATSDYSTNKYRDMVRDAITQKIDWHENADYNGGKTANERYLGDVFNIKGGMEARHDSALKRLVGRYGQADALVEDAKKAKDKWSKTIIGIGIGILAIGTATYLYINRKNKQSNVNKVENKLNKVA